MSIIWPAFTTCPLCGKPNACIPNADLAHLVDVQLECKCPKASAHSWLQSIGWELESKASPGEEYGLGHNLKAAVDVGLPIKQLLGSLQVQTWETSAK